MRERPTTGSLEHLGKAIDTGESTSIWNDSWINPELKLKPIGHVLLQDRDLMVSDLLTRETREWNAGLAENLLPELKDHIMKLLVSWANMIPSSGPYRNEGFIAFNRVTTLLSSLPTNRL